MKDEESEMIIKSNERRIIDLQREVAQLLLEKNTAVDDRNKIYDVLELLKTKYNTVLNEKIAQNEELMKVIYSGLFFFFRCHQICGSRNNVFLFFFSE